MKNKNNVKGLLDTVPKEFSEVVKNCWYLRIFILCLRLKPMWLCVLPDGKLTFNVEILRDLLIKNEWSLRGEVLAQYQKILKVICLHNQNYTDSFSGENLKNVVSHKWDLHHALITRNDVKGCRDEVKFLIHNPLNCIVVSSTTHHKHPHIQDRNYNARLLLNTYGEENKGVLERFIRDFPIQTTIKNYYSNL